MPHKNYGKFARWAQSQKLGMVKQVGLATYLIDV